MDGGDGEEEKGKDVDGAEDDGGGVVKEESSTESVAKLSKGWTQQF